MLGDLKKQANTVFTDQELFALDSEREKLDNMAIVGAGALGAGLGYSLSVPVEFQLQLNHRRRGVDELNELIAEMDRAEAAATVPNFRSPSTEMIRRKGPGINPFDTKPYWWAGVSDQRNVSPNPDIDAARVVLNAETGEDLGMNSRRRAYEAFKRQAREDFDIHGKIDDMSHRWLKKGKRISRLVPAVGILGGAGLGVLLGLGLRNGEPEVKTAAVKRGFTEEETDIADPYTLVENIRIDPRTHQHYAQVMSNDPLLALKASGDVDNLFEDSNDYSGVFQISPRQAEDYLRRSYRDTEARTLPLSLTGATLGGASLGAVLAHRKAKADDYLVRFLQKLESKGFSEEQIGDLRKLTGTLKVLKPRDVAKGALKGSFLGAGAVLAHAGLKRLLSGGSDKAVPLFQKGREHFGLDKESSAFKFIRNADPFVSLLSAGTGAAAGSYVSPEDADALGAVLGGLVGAGAGVAGSALFRKGLRHGLEAMSGERELDIAKLMANSLGGAGLLLTVPATGSAIASVRRNQLANAEREAYLSP